MHTRFALGSGTGNALGGGPSDGHTDHVLTRCGPRPRGLGLAPVKGPFRARCRAHGVAVAGVSLDKQRSDRGGLLSHVRGHWPMRATCCRRALMASSASATSSLSSSVGRACECTFGVHAIRTPSLVEIHNDGVGQFREHYRPRSAQCAVRSAQCVVRAHAEKLYAHSPWVLARANGCQFAFTPSTLTCTTCPK